MPRRRKNPYTYTERLVRELGGQDGFEAASQRLAQDIAIYAVTNGMDWYEAERRFLRGEAVARWPGRGG